MNNGQETGRPISPPQGTGGATGSTKEFWEKADYRPWDEANHPGASDPMHWSKRRFLSHLVPRLSGKSVLELGCGPGVLTPYLAETAQRVVAIDFSERALMTARSRCALLDNVEFVAADVMQFTRSSSFDVITGAMFLHEIMVNRTPQFIDRLKSLLSEEGFIYFHENSYFNPVSRFVREHLVGRYGIPKHGSEHELPFDSTRFSMYKDAFRHCHRFVDGVELITKVEEYFVPVKLGGLVTKAARAADRALTRVHTRTGFFTDWSYTQTVYASASVSISTALALNELESSRCLRHVAAS